MLADFTAQSDLRGHQIHLELAWVASGDRPGLRLLRRQGSYPSGPEDGSLVLDLGELFDPAGNPWRHIECNLCTISYQRPQAGTPQEVGQAEAGATPVSGPIPELEIIQAQVAFYFPLDETIVSTPVGSSPTQVLVSFYDPSSAAMSEARLEGITRLERTISATPDWAKIETTAIFGASGSGQEISLGQIIVRTGHTGGAPNRFEWRDKREPAVSVDLDFDQAQQQETAVEVAASTGEWFRADFLTSRLGVPLRTLTLDESFDPDTGDWRRRVTLKDQSLGPEAVYYYTLFAANPSPSGPWRSEPGWRTFATATGRYGLDETLYQLLPELYRRYDEPEPPDRGKGELRRFLHIFGGALDQARSLAESLRDRHDVLSVRADLLPHLAHWIGWEPDSTLDVQTQRNDLLYAPEVFGSVGTLPNLRALVNQATGWDCEIKEFVHNVFLTNAPETVHLWEVWERRHDGTKWLDPVQLTRTDGFDGRPAAAVDSGGSTWLFWHAQRSGRREIWLQRLDGDDPAPRRAMLGTPDDTPGLSYSDESPAALADRTGVRLFWESNRGGRWDIWARLYDGLPGGAPVRLTDHPAQDRCPAAVRDSAGHMWLFWQSDRRGPTDIWARVFDGSTWGLPARITTAQFRDETPAAVLHPNGQIWLFWSADLGDRRSLRLQIHDGSRWSTPQQITEGPYRDESPSAIVWKNRIWLFWHSNRNGHWQLWAKVYNRMGWSTPFAIINAGTTTSVTGGADEKEPAVIIDDAGRLRLFGRSQRRGNGFRSRALDFNDPAMLAEMGTLHDRVHYTYDTGLSDADWYARGVVAIYLAPPEEVTEEDFTRAVERARSFVEPFRPVSVRFVWLKK